MYFAEYNMSCPQKKKMCITQKIYKWNKIIQKFLML